MKQNQCRWKASKGRWEESLPHFIKSSQECLPSTPAAKGRAYSFGHGTPWLPSKPSPKGLTSLKDRYRTTFPLAPNPFAVLAHAVPGVQPSAHPRGNSSHGSHAMPLFEVMGSTKFPVNGPCANIPPKGAGCMASPKGPNAMSPAPHGMVPSSRTSKRLQWSAPEVAPQSVEEKGQAHTHGNMAAGSASGAGHALGIQDVPRRHRVDRLSLLLRHWCVLYQVQQRQQACQKTAVHGTVFHQ